MRNVKGRLEREAAARVPTTRCDFRRGRPAGRRVEDAYGTETWETERP